MRRSIALLAAVVTVALVAPPAVAASGFGPPVDAPIVDPFRAPDGPYGPGNRGLEYDTVRGAVVRAAGDGVVIFAGPVGGSLHVTIDHGGGRRSSYSFLDRLTTVAGRSVQRGDVVGRAGSRLHFGVRVDGRYVDPAPLFGRWVVDVRLLPTGEEDDPLPAWEVARRHEIAHLLQIAEWQEPGPGIVDALVDAGRALDALAGDVVSVGDLLDDPLGAVDDVRSLLALAADVGWVTPVGVTLRTLVTLREVLDPPGECTPASATVTRPPGRRLVVTLDGFDTAAGRGRLDHVDWATRGYDPGDVVALGYADPLGDPAAERGASTGSLAASVDHVVARLEELALLHPGTAIDVVAHGQGGVVVRLALDRLAERIERDEIPVRTAVTIASPHHGMPLATLVETTRTVGLDGGLLDAAAAVDDVPLDRPALEDLSGAGFVGATSSVPFPAAVHAVTIGGSTDLVVPGASARAPGARHVLIDTGLDAFGAHDDLVHHPHVRRELELAVAGAAPGCTTLAGPRLRTHLPALVVDAGSDALALAPIVVRVGTALGG